LSKISGLEKNRRLLIAVGIVPLLAVVGWFLFR